MNGLISRKALMKDVQGMILCDIKIKNRVVDLIQGQPAAYDVDKVVENLMNSTYIDEEKCYFIPEEAIEIVKRGGQE